MFHALLNLIDHVLGQLLVSRSDLEFLLLQHPLELGIAVDYLLMKLADLVMAMDQLIHRLAQLGCRFIVILKNFVQLLCVFLMLFAHHIKIFNPLFFNYFA